MLRVLPIALAVLLAAPVAVAGTPEAPEVSDPAGDAACYTPLGNEYADILAAWIDGETETSFMVHILLSKFTAEQMATATGYTIQFTHQGVQFGAIAAYIPPPFGEGWEFDNGFVDTESGELRDFVDAEGSFTPGPPAIISIQFAKSLFPHGDSNDNKLVGFTGGSADFKNWVPFFVVDVEPPVPFQLCDQVESAAEYVFQVGGHSAHGAPAGNATTPGDGAPGEGNQTATDDSAAVVPAAAPAADTPFPPVVLALVIVGLVALLRRRA